ncbi:MAG: metallophosphoesterase family protein [Saprospiraceae bacterium]|jgi:predicted phosphodiesterase|nr:metallophosphoesterase family protein [Saprospiraceae bacterium]
MKRTKDLGTKSGRILLFGGVYSNLQSLNKLMQIAALEGIPPENIICTGDIVGYCAQPEECLQKIKAWGIHSILGNVEIQLRDGEEDCGCNFDNGSRCDLFSRQWYPFAKANVSASSLEYLQLMPDHIQFKYAGKQCLVVHGHFHETAGYIFKSTSWEAKQKQFDDAAVEIILGGHSGLPFNDIKGSYLWLNAGVIGMPANDGTTRVWYMILDDKDGKLDFKHFSYEYDFAKANQLMKANHLPPQYAKTLRTGLWDNCEILPDVETAQQGKMIHL